MVDVEPRTAACLELHRQESAASRLDPMAAPGQAGPDSNRHSLPYFPDGLFQCGDRVRRGRQSLLDGAHNKAASTKRYGIGR